MKSNYSLPRRKENDQKKLLELIHTSALCCINVSQHSKLLVRNAQLFNRNLKHDLEIVTDYINNIQIPNTQNTCTNVLETQFILDV